MKTIERINGMLDAINYLKQKQYLDAAAELVVLVTVELAAIGCRFDEEKPPAAGAEAIG